MKIISKFRDYYDGPFDSDDSIVYVRHTEELELGYKYNPLTKKYEYKDQVPNYLRFLFPKRTANFHATSKVVVARDIKCDQIRVWFCGMVYTGYEISSIYSPAPSPKMLRDRLPDVYVWTKEQLETLCRQHKLVLSDECKKTFIFDVEDKVALSQEHKIAIASFCSSSFNTPMYLNPNLSMVQFQKRIDAYQARQELSMWFGNLAPESKPIVQIEDKFKIAEHGFDKWSFRKQPKDM